jgi:hypothetical protein
MENIIGEIGANFVESLKASRPLVGFRWLITTQDYCD